jgi:hypothetical protein
VGWYRNRCWSYSIFGDAQNEGGLTYILYDINKKAQAAEPVPSAFVSSGAGFELMKVGALTKSMRSTRLKH